MFLLETVRFFFSSCPAGATLLRPSSTLRSQFTTSLFVLQVCAVDLLRIAKQLQEAKTWREWDVAMDAWPPRALFC